MVPSNQVEFDRVTNLIKQFFQYRVECQATRNGAGDIVAKYEFKSQEREHGRSVMYITFSTSGSEVTSATGVFQTKIKMVPNTQLRIPVTESK